MNCEWTSAAQVICHVGSPCRSTHFKLTQLPKYLVCHRFVEPVYYDPTDYFDIAQHEVDRQDELEYEVRAHY